MKTKVLTLALIVASVGLTLADIASAAVIQPTNVWVTSFWGMGNDGFPNHMINGSGLSGTGPLQDQTHNNSVSGMWHAGPTAGTLGGPTGSPPSVASQAIVFDLGALFDLSGTFVWNHNQFNALGRGVKLFEILYSTDTDPLNAVFISVGQFNLAKALGNLTEGAQFLNLSGTTARLVKFKILSVHSGNSNDYVGLSEVMFAGEVAAPVPVPPAVWLMASGLLGMLGFSRRNN